MFYIPCNLGFEEELVLEIKESWPWLIALNGTANALPYPDFTLDRGGVSVDAPLELGIQLNFFLKTAHRILWRVADFKCRDFPKLFEKVKQLSWEKYLSTSDVEWAVAASKSRLNNEKRIEETCREAFSKSSGVANLPKSSAAFPAQKVFVRTYDDQCTISLDCSGEHLHKRGWGTRKGEAPLRETLAAFALRLMTKDAGPSELGNVTLIDPMCGSGTILLEALSMSAPNFNRVYSFQNWKHTPKLFKTELWKKNYKFLGNPHPFKAYDGFDLDEKVLSAARDNFSDLQRMTEPWFATELPELRFEPGNLFSSQEASGFAAGPVWCIANPPYGERLKVQGQGDFSYDDLLAKMVHKFGAVKVGLILPDKMIVKNMKPPSGFEKTLEVPFSNGGLDVLFLIYEPTVGLRHPPKR